LPRPLGAWQALGRPVTNQLQVLARLRRNRGLAYVADFLLARAADRLEMWLRRKELQQAVRVRRAAARAAGLSQRVGCWQLSVRCFLSNTQSPTWNALSEHCGTLTSSTAITTRSGSSAALTA